jgi:hypothetical protein
MWREHDANLASVWHHDDEAADEPDIGATLRERIVLDEVIVLHEVISRDESARLESARLDCARSECARRTFRPL